MELPGWIPEFNQRRKYEVLNLSSGTHYESLRNNFLFNHRRTGSSYNFKAA